MEYETNHFRFTEKELQLIRSIFPYRNIPFEDISKVELKKGIRIKHKVRTLIFGLILLTAPLLIIFSIDVLKMPNFHQMDDPRRFAVVILVCLMSLFMGLMSIYVSTIKIPIMKTIYRDGSFDIFSVKRLIKKGELEGFVHFLKSNAKNSLIEVNDDIIK